jgi:hypothetical protein
MIPLLLFIALFAILIPLFIYSFIDHHNRLYGNIIAAFLVSIIAAYLAVSISIGIVQYDPVVTFGGTFLTNSSECLRYDNQTQDCLEWNNTTTTNNICDTCPGTPIKDASFGYMLSMISIIMMIYTLLMIYEAFDERNRDRESEE